MKKMITIVAALFVAAAAQAAVIDWEINGRDTLKHQSGVGNVAAGVLVYLVFADDAATLAATIAAGTFLTQEDVLGSYAIIGSQGNFGGTTASAIHDNIDVNVVYEFAIIAFNEQYTGAEGSSGYYKIITGGGNHFARGYAPPPGNAGATDPAAWIGVDAAAAPWVAYTVIPEPTAMALLALGAAAVGLRRRFRK